MTDEVRLNQLRELFLSAPESDAEAMAKVQAQVLG